MAVLQQPVSHWSITFGNAFIINILVLLRFNFYLTPYELEPLKLNFKELLFDFVQ